MKVVIYKVLGLTKLGYINYVDRQFNDWCGPIAAAYYLPLRELTANVQLYNWFMANFNQRVITPFLKDTETYIMAGVEAPDIYMDLFNENLLSETGIYSIYPSAIINNIKKHHNEKTIASKENK